MRFLYEKVNKYPRIVNKNSYKMEFSYDKFKKLPKFLNKFLRNRFCEIILKTVPIKTFLPDKAGWLLQLLLYKRKKRPIYFFFVVESNYFNIPQRIETFINFSNIP